MFVGFLQRFGIQYPGMVRMDVQVTRYRELFCLSFYGSYLGMIGLVNIAKYFHIRRHYSFYFPGLRQLD
jgi:hypothetical protein